MPSTHQPSSVHYHLRQVLCMGIVVACGVAAAAAGERDAVQPLIGDKLISERLTHDEQAGGEIDRRIM